MKSSLFWREGLLSSLVQCCSHRWFVLCLYATRWWTAGPPVIFTFVLTPGIPRRIQPPWHKATRQGCCWHLLYLRRRVLRTNLGFRCEDRLEFPTPWLVRIVVSRGFPQHTSDLESEQTESTGWGQNDVQPSVHPPQRLPTLVLFLKYTSDLFSKTTFLQLPGTWRHKTRTKLIHLECLAFLYLYPGEGSSFIVHIISTHKVDIISTSSSNCNGYLLGYLANSQFFFLPVVLQLPSGMGLLQPHFYQDLLFPPHLNGLVVGTDPN